MNNFFRNVNKPIIAIRLTVVARDVGLVPVVAGVAREPLAVGRHGLRLGASRAGAPRAAAAVVGAVLRLGAAFALFPVSTHSTMSWRE